MLGCWVLATCDAIQQTPEYLRECGKILFAVVMHVSRLVVATLNNSCELYRKLFLDIKN